jgi:outer membrane receptor protein involved in Fe transport
VRLKANVERSYRVPNFDELFFPDKGFIRGNPALEPEDAIGFDAGFEIALERLGPLRDVALEAAYFRNDIDDSIVFVLINPFTVAPVNTGAATSQGVEAGLGFGLTPWLRFSGNYTFLDATLDATGTPLPGRARNELGGRAQLGPPSGVAKLVFEAIWTDQIPTTFTGLTKISGRTVLNASVSLNLARVARLARWLPLRDCVLSFGTNNLLDVSVRDAMFFPQPGRAFYGLVELRR